MGQIDTGGDRGVRRRMQEQQLGDPQAQYVVDAGDAWRQWVGEAAGDQIIDLAESTQDGRHQKPGKGAIAMR